MPLTLLANGETGEIKRVGGQDEVRKFLENLGFVTGEQVRVVSSGGGNIIVQVKDSRVAVSKGIAVKIMVLAVQGNDSGRSVHLLHRR